MMLQKLLPRLPMLLRQLKRHASTICMLMKHLLMVLLGLLVMLVLATAVFGLSFFVYGALLIPYLLVLFLFGIALGVIGCGIVVLVLVLLFRPTGLLGESLARARV